jgi:hypothetical protein
MMELEQFINNYSNPGMNPYIVLYDNAPLLMETSRDNVQVLDINNPETKEYLKGYDLQENTFNEYTGYLIHLSKGAQGSVQTCFLTSQSGFEQNVRNVIIAEENSNLEVFTGCLSSTHVKGNTHNAITDIFVGKNAVLTFNMIHSWGETSRVFPKTKAYVAEGGVFISNYVVWEKLKEISINPKVFVKDGGKAVMQSLVYAHDGSILDVGGKINLEGKWSSGEILSSVVSQGGEYKTVTEMVGEGDESRGHVECNAVLLENAGDVETIPLLKAKNSTVQLSHEASIGKISKQEIEYLQTKGLTEQEARELIVKGFVNNSVKRMPVSVQEKIAIMLTSEKGF